VVQWAADGVAVCSNAASQQGAVITADGVGGAIIAWSDLRAFLQSQIYAQRVNSAGVAQWTADGELEATLPGFGFVRVSAAVPGLANDAIILASHTMIDFVTGDFTTALVAQKANSAGAPQWGAAGAIVCDVSSLCSHEHMVDDGAGGAYVAWSDGRGQIYDIYMQRIDGAGAPQWAVNGNVVTDAVSWQALEGMMRGPGGDAFLTWSDQRNGQPDIYAARFNSAGVAQWTANGVQVTGAARGQYFSSIAPWKTASPERVYIAWTDNRAVSARWLYMQRLDAATGAPQYAADGITRTRASLISADAGSGRIRLVWDAPPGLIATVYRRTESSDWASIGQAPSDASGQVVFEDRDVVAGTPYGYRIGIIESGEEAFSAETWAELSTRLELALDPVRLDGAGAFVVSFTLPLDAPARLELFNVAGRRVLTRELAGLGTGQHALKVEDGARHPGVYFLKLTQGTRSVSARAIRLRGTT
jgi:hypothetical protein